MNASMVARQIEKEKPRKKIENNIKKYEKNFQRCQCLICGNTLDILTHIHAGKHGYRSKQEMIKAGKVKWL